MGKIRAELITAKLEGQQSRRMAVFTNDPARPRIDLEVRANVIGSVMVYPQGVLRLTNRRSSQTKLQMLVQRDALETGDVKLSDVRVDQKFLSVKAEPVTAPVTLNPRMPRGRVGDWLITLETDGDAPFGWNEATLKFKTGLKIQPEVTLDVRVESVPPVTLSRPLVELTREPGESSVLVSVRKGLDPTKLRVESKAKNLKLDLQVAGTRHFKLLANWSGSKRPEGDVLFVYEDKRYPVKLGAKPIP